MQLAQPLSLVEPPPPPLPHRPRSPREERAVGALRRLSDGASASFCFLLPDGAEVRFGNAAPVFSVRACTDEGLDAVGSLDALTIAHAYIAGHLDFEGDLVAALSYQEQLADKHRFIKVWRRLHPLLVGRARTNPQWIALHYDAQNAQLYAADRDYNTYTPGLYRDERDTLEGGAERKLAAAFDGLRLERGQRLLEVGSGWGGMVRYAARRGVHVTGITLSRRQKEHVDALIAREHLPAQIHYQDFFTFAPAERFDAISMMGVIEDLSDYRVVMRSLARWVKPGGRVYLDFAGERRRFGTHSFVTKHIWPGTFRMVFMPEFVEAVRESPFELLRVDNDRRNYHLWCRWLTDRWLENRAEVVAAHGEELWRKFLLLFAGVSALMDRRSHSATAYRVLLELPTDGDGAFWPRPGRAWLDHARGALSGAREAVLRALERGIARP